MVSVCFRTGGYSPLRTALSPREGVRLIVLCYDFDRSSVCARLRDTPGFPFDALESWRMVVDLFPPALPKHTARSGRLIPEAIQLCVYFFRFPHLFLSRS
jgi:hypothetical protein